MTIDAITGAARYFWFNALCSLTRDHVPNKIKVSDVLYRGGQPSLTGFSQLENMGVRTIVNLRVVDSDRPQLEKIDSSMKSIFIPFDPDNFDKDKTQRAAVDFLRTINKPENQPLYLHCYYGKERTGTLAAVYRIIKQNWTKEQAIAELRSDPNFHEARHPKLVQFIRELDVDAVRAEAEKI